MQQDERADDGEVVDAALAVLREVEREAGRTFVRQGDALLALWESTPADSRVGRTPHVLAEAGLVLGLHPRSVESRLAVAMLLQRQPLLRRLVLGGDLGVAHLLVLADELSVLGDDGLAARVAQEALCAEGRIGWTSTPARLRVHVRRVIVRLDPAGMEQRRREQTSRQSGVRLRPLADGLAAWVCTGPAAQLLAADRLLDVLSRRTGPDDERPHGQRQVDSLLGALVARAGAAVPVELQLEVPVRTVVAGIDVHDALPEPVVIRADLTGELLEHLADAATGTGGCGAAPSPGGRSATGRPVLSAQGRPPGRLHGAHPHDRARPLLDRLVAALSEVVPGPPRGAPEPQAGTSAPPRRRPRQGVPELTGAGPVDPGLLLEMLADPAGLAAGLAGLRIRRVCVDRTGQVVAVDARSVALGELLPEPVPRSARSRRRPEPGAGASATESHEPGSTAGEWPAQAVGDCADHGYTERSGLVSGRLLQRLLTHLPVPPPGTQAYAPTAAQCRVVRARDLACTFPGCGQRAQRTDLDHRTPFPHGPTTTANLHPLCRRHHRLKHDGWTCRRGFDGTTAWTSPRGQAARTTAA